MRQESSIPSYMGARIQNSEVRSQEHTTGKWFEYCEENCARRFQRSREGPEPVVHRRNTGRSQAARLGLILNPDS
jgi:hypothetical protein